MPKRPAPPRVNVVVTKEQHALLLELASLEPGLSASGFLRELLDRVTPHLRTTVQLMRTAAQETDSARAELREMLTQLAGLMQQQDLLDAPTALGSERTAAKRGPHRTARRGRPQK
jgi:hypothetical protein